MDLLTRNKIIVALFIIFLSVSPAFALGEGNRNLLLIGAMLITPIFILRYPIIIPSIDIPLISLCAMMIFFPLVLHPETMRWSTILYSCLFCLYFMSFVRVLYHSTFTGEDFLKLLRGLLFAYCIVLIIQQFCVLTGLPIFNVSNYNPLEPWKLNSLMAEPSHSARVLAFLMFMYIITYKRVTKIEDIREILLKEKKVFFSYLYSVLTMGSGTAFLLLFVLIMAFIPIKRIGRVILFCLLLSPMFYFAIDNIQSANRAINFVSSLLQFDEHKLIQEDLSAAIRIVPTIHGAKAVSVFTVDGLLGHGVDADGGLTPLPSVDCGAGSFSIWYNFGFLVALLFWVFTLYICFLKENTTISIIFWLLLCFFYGGFNNQLIWFTLSIMVAYKYTKNGDGDKA